jgi:ATP phosphoribosyltransferase
MYDGVVRLLADAGIEVRMPPRGYRVETGLPWLETKVLKPQNIVEMLHAGSRDLGFAGADWVAELDADLVELLDTTLDPVRLVAAAPESILVDGRLPARPLVVASEYANLTRAWIRERGLEARFVKSFGATEVFPPEDADCIVDNTATGSTLRANQLEILDELLRSSTRLYANPTALKDPEKKQRIEDLVLLLRSVLEARRRVMLEVNISPERMAALVDVLPAMRRPTVSPLHGEDGFAVKAAVPRRDLPSLIPAIQAAGGTDLVVSEISQLA